MVHHHDGARRWSGELGEARQGKALAGSGTCLNTSELSALNHSDKRHHGSTPGSTPRPASPSTARPPLRYSLETAYRARGNNKDRDLAPTLPTLPLLNVRWLGKSAPPALRLAYEIDPHSLRRALNINMRL